MDFQLTDEQIALRELATSMLDQRVTPERLAEQEKGTWFDEGTWRELASTGLLGVSLPESVDGGGAGLLETALLLEQVGAHAAHLPVWPTVVLHALAVAQFGTAEQQSRDLPGVCAGDVVLTAALTETGRDDPRTPALTRARRDGDGWLLDGFKTCVPVAGLARRILLGAQTPEGVTVFLLDPTADGVTLREGVSTDLSPQADLELAGVRLAAGDVLGAAGGGAEILEWVLLRAQTGLAAIQSGVVATALRMAADYTRTREQFQRPIGSFQAVGHRLADAYVEVEGIRLSMLQAVWRLEQGLPALDEVAIAKWWAAEGGHKVVHAAQHVHGGVGVDTSYPLHRFFRVGTWVEFTLGGARAQALELGARMAVEPA